MQYPRGDDPAALSKLMDNNSLVKFESWLAMKGTTFLLADSPTCPDFHLWELLDQLVEAAAVDGVAKGPFDGRPHLKMLYVRTYVRRRRRRRRHRCGCCSMAPLVSSYPSLSLCFYLGL